MHALGPHDVHLWLTFYDGIEGTLEAMHPLLNAAELARGQAYRAADDRKRHIVTRALLRTVLSRYADVAPAAWQFEVNQHGRPAIARGIDADGLCFNLSHTRGLIALAVGRRRELGVDVEYVNGRQVSPRMAQRFFSAREAAALAQSAAGAAADCQRRLLEYWTFKEAYVKARGEGLTFPLNRFSVELIDAAGVRLEIDPAWDDAARWHLAQYRPAPDYLLALCAERLAGDTPRISLYQAVPAGEPAPCPAPPWRSSGPGQAACSSSRSK